MVGEKKAVFDKIVSRLLYNDACYIQDHPRKVLYVWCPMIGEWNQADRTDIPLSYQSMARTIQTLQMTALFQPELAEYHAPGRWFSDCP